jgi:hypothetical protein
MTDSEYSRLVEFLSERFTEIDRRFVALEGRFAAFERRSEEHFREMLGHLTNCIAGSSVSRPSTSRSSRPSAGSRR